VKFSREEVGAYQLYELTLPQGLLSTITLDEKEIELSLA